MEESNWLAGGGRVERDRRRHPRFEVDLPGSIVHMASGEAAPVHVLVRLESISRGGGRVRLVNPSADWGAPGKSKLLVIHHETQRGHVYRANVAWFDGQRLGLEIVARAISLEEGALSSNPLRVPPSIERLLEDLGRVRRHAAHSMSAHRRFRSGA